jgi:TolB-like protein/Tfp pilus assembly protein PilF
MRKTESPTPLASTNAGAGTRPPTTETAAPKAAEKSVAVLAFENVGGDKENEIFSDGVPDEILTQLGKVAGLRLTGRNSSFALRGRPEAEVAQKLNVSLVVSGSVQRVGSQVKITARLVNAADGTQLWQDRFTEEMKDIFTVQEKIAGLIAQNLSLKLSGASRVAKSVDPEAQRLVLEGRYHWNLRNDEGFTRAEAAFTKAITMAPDLAVAHSGLAGVWAIRGNYHQMDGMTDGREEIGRARSAAERAVQFDPNLAEAHAVLAFCLLVDGKLEESERSFQRALALNPSSTVTLSWHALVLRLMGRVDLAIAEYQRLAIMDPLWFINLLLLGSNLSDVGQWDEALSVLDRAMALRNDPYMPAVGARARALFVLGRKSDAVEMARLVRRRFDVFPRWQADAQAVFVLRQAGLEKEAAEHAAEVFARAPADSYLRGFVHVALGQFERALPYLERTSSTTGRSFVYLDQMWDPWRDDARFLQVIAKIGSPRNTTSLAKQWRVCSEGRRGRSRAKGNAQRPTLNAHCSVQRPATGWWVIGCVGERCGLNGAAPPIAEAQGANGSMRRRPWMPAKSSVLCVTSGRRWVSAVAAMMASPSLRRLSWRRRIASATISSVSGNVSTVAKKPAKAAMFSCVMRLKPSTSMRVTDAMCNGWLARSQSRSGCRAGSIA